MVSFADLPEIPIFADLSFFPFSLSIIPSSHKFEVLVSIFILETTSQMIPRRVPQLIRRISPSVVTPSKRFNSSFNLNQGIQAAQAVFATLSNKGASKIYLGLIGVGATYYLAKNSVIMTDAGYIYICQNNLTGALDV
jgi:hypothetical protein